MLTITELYDIATKKNFRIGRTYEKTENWSDVDLDFEKVDTAILEPELGINVKFHVIDGYCYYVHTINNLKGTTRRSSVMTRKLLFD